MQTRNRPVSLPPSDRHPRLILALVIAALLAPAVLSGIALAKGPGLVRVDPPIDLGAAPETWLDVRFVPFQVIDDGAEIPWTGGTFVVRLVPVDATAPVTRFPARERPAGSGRFEATVIVPDSGLAGVQIGLLGESCEQGACTVSDMPFELTDGSVVAAAMASQSLGAAPVVEPAEAVPHADPDTIPDIVGSVPLPSALLGLVGVVGLAAVGLRVTSGLRSRPRAPDR